MGHGWEGVVLKLLRGEDFTFTVTGSEEVTPEYRRVRFTDGGLLARSGVHPTMWVRVWFERDGRPHQRAYTLVDPDPEQGTFSLEFALHEGTASDWARTAAPGDTIDATVQGTGFTAPDPAPAHLYAVADPASLPALNSLLDTFPATPATIWFEAPDGTEPAATGLPFRTDPTRHTVHTVPRERAGARLTETVKSALPAFPADAYLWIATDTRTTRALAGWARKELGAAKERVSALGYWRP
ncbi:MULTISPECIES: siderophore-interacting protein [Streptomyces]|uniref:siderophore-interacting protein n=1 Tax=Streptomyces TaxID=1883 RepID=UPI0002F4607F|nr:MULTISPECIES: siderophore-interacting protein [unclassified Streptomyces]MBP3077912.1 FAD-binding protein [Streptomyces sp. 604F]QHV86966.1 siderophore-interacting protein [Streptomyces sp. 604F]QOZ99746.1 siderophore-interacting protein [Streptomyces violascens]WSB22083.1 siderophore-interacting protein [Streptomyces albidoflavus]